MPLHWHVFLSVAEWLLLSSTWALQGKAVPDTLPTGLFQTALAVGLTSLVVAALQQACAYVKILQAKARAHAKERSLSDEGHYDGPVSNVPSSTVPPQPQAAPSAKSPGQVNKPAAAVALSKGSHVTAAQSSSSSGNSSSMPPTSLLTQPRQLLSESKPAEAEPSQLLADIQASLQQLTHAAAAATTMRESALQRLAEVMGDEFADELRACGSATTLGAAAATFPHLQYTSLCKVQPVGVKVCSCWQVCLYWHCTPACPGACVWGTLLLRPFQM